MSTFVLIHGGLHGSWCWERIREPLVSAGHEVVAVDLPGRGEQPGADLGIDAYVDVVAAAVERAQQDVVIVAHSLGGVVASQFAERERRPIGTILVNALLVENAEATFPKLQAAGAGCLLLRPGTLSFSDDGRSVSIAPDAAIEAFYNRCEPADAAWAAGQLCPEPIPPLTVPLKITPEGFGNVPKLYLGARDDNVLPWSFQKKMSSACGATLIELGGDHSPFLSVPDKLVAHLLAFDSLPI
jgi:pimeloyl-ACP methyl ester carboxylesterase